MIDSDRAAQLRHDLLTLFNHVLGYAELLLEESTDADDPGRSHLLAIVRAGREAISALRRVLSPEAVRDGGADQLAVVAALDGALTTIERRTSQLLAEGMLADADPRAADVERIRTAAEQARSMAAGGVALRGADARARPKPAAPPVDQSAAGQGVILVVDDDEATRELLARRLGRLGYVTLEAGDGLQALEVVARHPVDLMLLDLQMPNSDGFDVLERRRADDQLREIPVVMISSLDDVGSIVRCIEMGAEDYLPKPFDPVLLQARIGSCLDRKRLRDQERELVRQLAEWNTTLEGRVREQVDEVARLSQLRRFLSPQLADAVVSAGAEAVLQSHRRQIAVLFCDLRGFTSFAEVTEPEDVMAVLADYHQAMGELVREFGATVGFFAGDGLMVFFNDPVPCPNPAERAARMAVAMRDHMEQMSRDWHRRGHDLGFGVGVSFGYATLGEIGFEGRFDYGVIGSVVNLASRLCGQAKAGEILVSQRARRELEELAVVEDRGLLELAGFHDPVPAFVLVGMKDVS